MYCFNADLHIHSCLSPCGDLSMSPRNIIYKAKEKGMHIIAVTDHNTTKNVEVCVELGKRHSIYVIPACEVNTIEEVHCLCYFQNVIVLKEFQTYLDDMLPDIKNDTDKFGFQVAVDKDDIIVYEEERSLFMAINDSIDNLAKYVYELDGIFIPAHVDRPKNSIFSQLGFIPFDLKYSALEISKHSSYKEFIKIHPELSDDIIITNSDAHYPEDIATVYNKFKMGKADWDNFKAYFKETCR